MVKPDSLDDDLGHLLPVSFIKKYISNQQNELSLLKASREWEKDLLLIMDPNVIIMHLLCPVVSIISLS